MSERKHFLYKLQPTRLAMLTDGPDERESALVSQHFAYLQDLLAQGVVILAGRTLNSDASSFGIVIFHAGDEAEALTIMQADPAVKHGVMRAELYPYGLGLFAGAPSA